MELLLFLILFPLIIALLMYALPEHALKHLLVRIGALVIGVASVYLVVTSFAQGAVFSTFASEPAGQIMFVIEMLMALFILYMGVRCKNYLAVALILVQSAMMVYFETTYAEHLTAIHNLFVDDFTLIMTLIIGIIGSLICVYSIRYMQVFHEHHPEVTDRRRMFFFVLFAFLSAMFGLVFSNNLVWVYFFWEVTTLCSFVLIGYTQTDEAIKNSFRALVMNLLGGLGFAAALLAGVAGAVQRLCHRPRVPPVPGFGHGARKPGRRTPAVHGRGWSVERHLDRQDAQADPLLRR